jgi:pimeloyl-ACP methyl ester carboxylesterase
METWDPLFVNTLARHYRLVIFDNAGTGATAELPGPLTIDAMAAQTSGLIDALRLGQTDVLGWSMGGMIAQALAVTHPGQVRRLVLCASFPGTGRIIKPPQKQIDALTSGNPQSTSAALFPADGVCLRRDVGRTVALPGARHSLVGDDRRSGQRLAAVVRGGDAAGRETTRIAAPTLIADGAVVRHDPPVNVHRRARLWRPTTRLVEPHAGHA